MRRKKNKPVISSSTTAALEIASVKSGGVPPNKAHLKPCTTPTMGFRLYRLRSVPSGMVLIG